MNYREYDEKILQKIKDTEKDILIKFISICEKYNLKYFIVFGTLLGTIRHKGFIPWDDDIDVGMMREDYEKFLEVAQKECGEEYYIQTADTDPAYHLYFAKMRMKDTVFVENTLQKGENKDGFYIDIFPFDVIPDDEKKARKQMKKSVILGMLFSIRKVKEPQIGTYGVVKDCIMRMIWYSVHYVMKLFKDSDKKLWKYCQKNFTKYQGCDYKRVVTFSANAERWIIENSEIEELVNSSFEDIVVKIPKGYDGILKRCYGDYMVLPPKSQRVNHMPVMVKFKGEEKIIL